MKKFMHVVIITVLFSFFIAGCTSKPDFKIEYEQYKLANGLDVILHEDKSDPIVSVAVQYHVGSNREEVGRTGFAHLFEHMLFQESQHVGEDQFFKKIQDAGGTLNGFTWEDGTGYFEIVPKNALEMALWMESDRMGFLLSTVTQESFENQQGVVQNEKRQGVDNRPYGHTWYVIGKLLYPENHPYNWQVIGSMEDLRKATLKDVHDFYKKWYGPNNATLVIAGDFDQTQTKEWVEKYFGEIKASDPITDPKPRPVTLSETKRAFHEDEFAKSPELNMVFPTIQEYEKDAYALDYLGRLLGGTKKAPLYKIIVEEEKLAPSVSSYQYDLEITGAFYIRVRAFPDKNLTDIEKAIKDAFTRFEEEGFTEKDLERTRIQIETGFYNGIASILSKSFRLAQFNEYTGSPGFITSDLQNYLDVTIDDVWRVYNKYIKDKPYVLTSFVPKGQVNLIAENSEKFPVVIESLEEQKIVSKGEKVDLKVEKIPSNFDRSVEPPKGPQPLLTLPEVWQDTLANGIRIVGIEHTELPLVRFSINVHGGLLAQELDKVGVAHLTAKLMMEGTKNKTPIELEEAMDELGANIWVGAQTEQFKITSNMLSSTFEQTFQLVKEILLEPRWDEKEFTRLKEEVLEQLNRDQNNPSSVAYEVHGGLIIGKDHSFYYPSEGSKESAEALTMDDLKEYYTKYVLPSSMYITVAGNISKAEAVSNFKDLEKLWQPKEVTYPTHKIAPKTEKAKLYFIDFPGAKQSHIRIGYLGLKRKDPDYYPATVMLYKLGGSFSGNLNLILREEKGYTYGARTKIWGTLTPGSIEASAAVQSTATLESIEIFRDEMNKYRQGISEEDLTFTKNSLIKSNSREFETLQALNEVLMNIAKFDLPVDYIKNEEDIVRNFTLEQHRKLAQKYIEPDKMIYLVVGDAKTQLKPLSKLGLGKPVMLDRTGAPIN
jgi:zinc protease